jgi:signal transduction histidine kinase
MEANLDERILILAPTGRDAWLACRSLKESGIAGEECAAVEELCSKLEEGAGAALIADEALSFEAIETLGNKLRASEPWSDLPLIVLTTAGAEFPGGCDIDLELGQYANVTFLERPVAVQTLVSAAKVALRARRRQYECRDLLLKQRDAVARLDLLAEIANHLLLTDKPHEVVGGVFRKISAHLRLELYFNYLYDPDENVLRLNSWSGISEEQAGRIDRLELGEGFCGSVASSQQASFAENVQSSGGTRDELIRNLGMTAYVCFPLVAGGRLVGTLSFGSRERTRFQHDELAVLATISNQIAVAIERQHTEEQVQDLNQALENRVHERTAQLQHRTAQLQDSMDQMEAFAYSISHDLRAPLRVIRGFSEALLEDYPDQLDATALDYLRRICAGGERMDTLIQDLLEYSRLGRAKLTFQPLSLDDLVGNVITQLEGELQSRKATITVAHPLPEVRGHGPTLVQALTNLISNSIKFVAPGVAPSVRIYATVAEQRVRLWVEDNGIGIPPQHQQRIFGVFERLHNSEAYPGTGIGLAIVAKAITRMGGTVGVESSGREGSRFWFELPRPERDQASERRDVEKPVTLNERVERSLHAREEARREAEGGRKKAEVGG